MKPSDLPTPLLSEDVRHADELLAPLLRGPALKLSLPQGLPLSSPVHGVLTGSLLALADHGQTALVSFPGQPGLAAVPARTVVDLHGPHIGQDVVLMFEAGDVNRPIVMGVVRGAGGWPLAAPPATVDVDVDGQRMTVSATEQMVLRCGRASITLTKAGKVLIEGSYVSSQSSGVNRLKGGSVQLN